MAYAYLAFISSTSDADINVLKTNLDNFYATQKENTRPKIVLTASKIKLTFKGKYNFFISLSAKKHVQAEAIEFAAAKDLDFAEEVYDKELLKTASSRFEISANPDYDMDYFNDCIFILQQVEKFSNVFIFNVD